MFIIITVSIVILIYRNFTTTRDMTITNRVSVSSRLLQLEAQNFDYYLADLANFCILPYYDSHFTRIINQKAPASAKQLDYAEQQMNYYYYTRNDIQEYEIYLMNQGKSIGRGSNQHMTLFLSPSFDAPLASALCASSKKHQAILADADSDNSFFTYYHTLFQVKGKKQQAIVRLKISTSYLNQLMYNDGDASTLFALLTSDNECIYSNNVSTFSDRDAFSDILTTKETFKNDAELVSVGGDDYLLITADSGANEFRLINLIPLASIDSDIGSIGFFMLINGFLLWFCTILAIYFVVRLLTYSLRLLSTRMQHAGSGDFHTFPELNGNKEIVDLSKSFNSMLSHIDDLIQKNYLSEISEKNAKLTALEAQLNPHFLYNTLQAISTEALVNDQPKTYHMITALASNLRYTIKNGDLVPLEQELQYLSHYIYLLKIRMDDYLQYEIVTDKALDKCLVPKISLQTLVENSIIHGRSSLDGTICIRVHIAKSSENQVQIRVWDNGCGISGEQLTELKKNFLQATTSNSPVGIGLTNLYVRLHLLYQTPADIQISSKINEFTEVVLTLPYTTERRRLPYV